MFWFPEYDGLMKRYPALYNITVKLCNQLIPEILIFVYISRNDSITWSFIISELLL